MQLEGYEAPAGQRTAPERCHELFAVRAGAGHQLLVEGGSDRPHRRADRGARAQPKASASARRPRRSARSSAMRWASTTNALEPEITDLSVTRGRDEIRVRDPGRRRARLARRRCAHDRLCGALRREAVSLSPSSASLPEPHAPLRRVPGAPAPWPRRLRDREACRRSHSPDRHT